MSVDDIMRWIQRCGVTISKSELNRELKRLEDAGRIVNVTSGEEGRKRRKGTFAYGCTMDFVETSSEANQENIPYKEDEGFTNSRPESEHDYEGEASDDDYEIPPTFFGSFVVSPVEDLSRFPEGNIQSVSMETEDAIVHAQN